MRFPLSWWNNQQQELELQPEEVIMEVSPEAATFAHGSKIAAAAVSASLCSTIIVISMQAVLEILFKL